MALLNKSRPPAFPPSQLRGIKPLPKNWETGKAGGRVLFNKAAADAATRRLNAGFRGLRSTCKLQIGCCGT